MTRRGSATAVAYFQNRKSSSHEGTSPNALLFQRLTGEIDHLNYNTRTTPECRTQSYHQVSLTQFVRHFQCCFVICDPNLDSISTATLLHTAGMDDDRTNFDNITWEESQKLFRRISTLHKIESFVTQKFGKTATWVTPMRIGGIQQPLQDANRGIQRRCYNSTAPTQPSPVRRAETGSSFHKELEKSSGAVRQFS